MQRHSLHVTFTPDYALAAVRGSAELPPPPPAETKEDAPRKQEKPQATEQPYSIQLISDMHVEGRPALDTRKGLVRFLHRVLPNRHGAKSLILAGDVGNPWIAPGRLRRLLRALSQHYATVYYIPGNHEYWAFEEREEGFLSLAATRDIDKDLAATAHLPAAHVKALATWPAKLNGARFQEAYAACNAWREATHARLRLLLRDLSNVMLLPRGKTLVPGDSSRMLLAAVLWSDHQGCPVSGGFQDYTRCAPHAVLSAWHAEDLAWLDEQLSDMAASAAQDQAIVVTHHVPLKALIAPKFQARSSDRAVLRAYCAGIEDFVAKHARHVSAWVCGHSHGAMSARLPGEGSTGVAVLNPLGHDDERTGYVETVVRFRPTPWARCGETPGTCDVVNASPCVQGGK
jgi:3',5'-cyclic AMP phosphodiesterase CpdA